MNIIGLDLSTKSGVVVLSDDPAFFFSTELENKKLKGLDRVVWFGESVGRLLNTYKPDVAIIEDYGYANAFTLVPLVEIGTAVRLACRDRGIPMVFIPPTSLKGTLGSGKLTKDMVMLEVYKKWNFSAATNNIADAYVLAKVGQMMHRLEKTTKEVSTKLQKITSVADYMARASLAF